MKFKLLTVALLGTSLSAMAMSSSDKVASNVELSPEATEANLNEARSLMKAFGGELKPELQKAMKEGGPVHAVGFCHSKAPQIALDLAEKSGWTVTRVSLKPRGAMANPDAWETQVLNNFEKLKAEGQPVQKMEFSEVVHVGDEAKFRYMKPLPTGEVCLKCHGANVAEPIKAAIAKFYPDDKAMGYKQGDIRGAFSFSKAAQ